MSSYIRRLALRNKKRPGLTSRGKKPGPAQQAGPYHYLGRGQRGLFWLTKFHNLEAADPKCKRCGGRGAIPSKYVDKKTGRAKLLACSCVPIEVPREKTTARATE